MYATATGRAYTPGLGETLTEGETFNRYRQWMLAARAARAAGNPVDERKALAEADRYRKAYLAFGAGDLDATDRLLLALEKVPGAVAAGAGNTLAAGLRPLVNVLMPLVPLALLGLGAYVALRRQRGRK